MDSNLTNQIQIVSDLKEKRKQLQDQLCDIINQLDKEQITLQKICQHDYVKEYDGDYHRPSYYHVCKVCNHFAYRI